MLEELKSVMSVNQKVQVTVWHPGDESIEYTFPSYIMGTDGEFFLIAAPSSQVDKILPLMQPGYVIGIVLETYPNPYIFYPIIHMQKNSESFWLKIPADPQIEVVQRRRHVRIPMVIPVEVEFQVGTKWITTPARTEDVSGGGMRLTSSRLFYKDQELRLHFQMNEEMEMMHLQARVIFSTENRVKKRPDDLYATACQFHDLGDAQEMLIVRECFRRELKSKR